MCQEAEHHRSPGSICEIRTPLLVRFLADHHQTAWSVWTLMKQPFTPYTSPYAPSFPPSVPCHTFSTLSFLHLHPSPLYPTVLHLLAATTHPCPYSSPHTTDHLWRPPTGPPPLTLMDTFTSGSDQCAVHYLLQVSSSPYQHHLNELSALTPGTLGWLGFKEWRMVGVDSFIIRIVVCLLGRVGAVVSLVVVVAAIVITL